ncbi:MAG: Fic family protein [Nostocaceae cyanobacterium]|nr:Fic family protein [Nostocaceae cyanobacterium]
MERGVQGDYVFSTTMPETFLAFVPRPLPPVPPLQLDGNLYDLIERANRALGRLDGLTTLLPEPSLFLYFYVRKEALLSSQIEGTQSSFSDLLLYEIEEAPGVPLDDVQEVSRYVAALNHGLARLREGFPLSLRLIREIHEVLLSEGRGSERTPGEFRRTQNWVGGTRPGNALFVPPPPTEVMFCLGELEKFLHDQPVRTPVLIKAALSHVQFETIHPFLDGNGRLGRLLITFLLCAEGALSEPLLYLSLYFKTHRQLYYDLLQQVRIKGDWEAWLVFFLEGVMVTSEQASSTARRVLTMFENDRQRIETIGRGANSTLRVHNLMRRKPLFSITYAKTELRLSVPTITSALKNLENFGMVKEVTGRSRDRLFVYREYLNILNEGI